jgi:Rrf2 family transcriptional regulator, nitric oxide-sensitive transcriptional repressor
VHLSRYTDYSLRVLMFLALRPDERATINEISKAYAISNAHLVKVVHELGQAGFLETVRGRGGGIRLARRADEIGVGDVVRHAEDAMALVECFESSGTGCAIEPACGLRPVLAEALGEFMKALDRYTLEDLVARRRSPLMRLLAAP